jgi:hypothetical protein
VNGNERECAGVNGNQRGRFAFRTRAELALWVAWSRGGGAFAACGVGTASAPDSGTDGSRPRGRFPLRIKQARAALAYEGAKRTPVHSRAIPFTPAYSRFPRTPVPAQSRSFPRNPVHSRALPFTPAQSRSLPRNPVHSRAIPFIPAHSRSLPRTPVHSRSFPFPPANPALLSRLDTECMGDTIHQNTTRSRPRSSACSCASTPPAECRSTGRSSTK